MSNFAATYLLSRKGFFDGLFTQGGNPSSVYLDRYDDIADRNRSKVFESYLGEGTKLYSWNIGNSIGEYKKEALDKLEMIEPPSFLEKMMVINRYAEGTKLGKIAGKATLGAVPVALTMVALSARAYGAGRHFVMEKLNLHDKSSKKSFSERLTEIRNGVGYKNDLKQMKRLEKIHEKSSVRRRLEWEGRSGNIAAQKDFPNTSQLVSQNALLKNYLEYAWPIDEQGKAVYSKDMGHWSSDYGTRYYAVERANRTPLKAEDLTADISRHVKAVEMIEPPTKTELKLIKRIGRLNEMEENMPVFSPVLRMVNRSVEKSMACYVARKEKEDKNFSGQKSMFQRLGDIQKRQEAQKRLEQMRILEKKLKGCSQR